MSVALIAPATEPSATATIRFSGEDYRKLLRLTRLNVTIPEAVANNPSEVREWEAFLNSIRLALSDDRPAVVKGKK